MIRKLRLRSVRSLQDLLLELFIIYVVLITTPNCVDSSDKQGYCKKGEECVMSTDPNNALAVVLYDEDNVLPHHKQERVYKFVNHELRIKQDWLGTGIAAVVWDSADVLSQYLEQNPDLVNGKTILELGAGTGLVGMVVAMLGGVVTITDREEVLHIPRQVISENLPSSALERTRVSSLDWSKDLDKYDAVYDVILGADIVYIEDGFPDLLKTLRKLSTKDTLILLSCRIRYDRDTKFLRKLEDYFNVEKILYDKEVDVLIYKLIKLID